MPIRHLPLLAAMLSPGFALAAAEPGPPPQPLLSADQLIVDVGEVDRGTAPLATFVLHNRGTAPLILEAQALAYSSVVHLDSEIGPGTSGRLEVRLDTLFADGPSEWKTILKTNDQTQPVVGLKSVADVVTWIAPSLPELRWITVQGEPLATLRVDLVAKKNTPFRVLSVSSPDPAIGLSFATAADGKPNEEPSLAWRVEATLDPKVRVGAITGRIVVETDHPKQPKVPINVSGFIRPIAAFHQADFDLGTLTRTDKPVAIGLRRFTAEPFKINSVTVEPPWFTTRVDALPDGKNFMIVLHPTPEAPSGPFSASVTAHLSEPMALELTVPVHGELE